MHHWRCWCNVGAMFVVFMTLARLFFDVGVLAGDDLHIRTRPVFREDIPQVQIRTSCVKAFESYRLTDRRTYIYMYRHHQNYIPRRFASGQQYVLRGRVLFAENTQQEVAAFVRPERGRYDDVIAEWQLMTSD